MADIIGDDEAQALTGTEGLDFLWGMGGFDQLFGLGGDDVYLLTDAFALVGFDVVVEAAGAGSDTVIVQRAAAPGGLGLSYTLTANVENGTIGGADTLPPEVQGVPPDAPFTLIGNALDNVLTGNRADNTLEGRDGADVLDGRIGFDSLIGGTGDDTYVLLDVTFPVLLPTEAPELVIPGLTPSYDGVTEAAGGGTDTVLVARAGTGTNVPTSYTLGANVENGIIGGVDSGLASDLAFSLSGNGLDNSLTGNRADNTLAGNVGADTLNGGSGLDTLIGGAGDDTYLLLDVSIPLIIPTAAPGAVIAALPWSYDAVTEAAGGGTDTVIVDLVPGADTPRSYTLGANIENGIVAGVGTGQPFDLPFSLVGNALDNSLTGNNGTNTLSGGGGADVLDGKFGLDTLVGGAGDDLYFILDATSSLVGTPFPTGFVTEYDKVTEAAGGGTDTVIVDRAVDVHALTSYTLGANIENGIVAGADTGQATDFAYTLSGNELDNLLVGNRSGNTLNGSQGADVMDGRAGIDTLVGGAGDDIYLVLDATTTLVGQPIPEFVTVYDTVTEAAGGGTDTVIVARAVALHALTSYTLGANVENGIVGGVDSGQATDEAFALTGNALANTLIGNRADNTLGGGAGADQMAGGAGNDTYVVDNAGDTVTEASGQGTDRVRSSVSFSLSGQSLENLTLLGSGNINGTGSQFGNTIIGNAGNNTIDGGAGADQMAGGAGNDTYVVDNAGDTVTEASGQGTDRVRSSVSFSLSGQSLENLTLLGSGNINGTGSQFGNTIIGNAGNNTINGGAGADTLTGVAGSDTFVFDSALGASSVDTLSDFNVAADTISLDNAIFTAIAGAGVLTVAQFTINASGTAQDASDRIVYETDTGKLFYDSNGSAAGGAVQFAVLDAGLTITNADFRII